MRKRPMPVPSTVESPAPVAPSADVADPLRERWPRWWPWAVGALVGLVVLGPGLGTGSLLSLDLLVTPTIPVPNGMFGLGPALSQRVPLFALLGAASAVVGGPIAVKAFLVVCTASAFAGAARLARVLGPTTLAVGVLGQMGAGLVWAAGPYALTRIGVGHINLVWALAVLPWALPRLCRPAEHLPSSFLASLALAVGGPGGGTLGLAVAAVALAALLVQGGPRRVFRPLAAVLAPHLIWVAPTAVLLWAGAGVTGSGGFATVASGWTEWPALAAGNGFWRADQQVGATGPLGAVAGLTILALSVVGGRRIVGHHGRRSWQATATLVAVVGLGLAVASAVPGVRVAYGWLSDLPFGAPLRESARFSALWLVWAAPAMAVGAASLAAAVRRRTSPSSRGAAPIAISAVPLLVGLVVSVPGWWGVGGRLEPVQFPESWRAARATIAARPGTVVALPWAEYPALSFAGGRQVFNPVPDYLGGDVISSYDPLFDPEVPSQEQVDHRAVVVDDLVRRARAGQPVAAGLARLGVRWVVVVHEGSWTSYGALFDDPGLRRVQPGPEVDLYEVRGWSGDATGPDGRGHDVARPLPPVLRTEAPAGSVLNVAGAPGWLQGWGSPARVTDDGRLELTRKGGVLWFWPAPALLLADFAIFLTGIWCLRSRHRAFGRILAGTGPRG